MIAALYVEKDSWLHRRSARTKLLGLAASSILLFVSDNLVFLAAAFCVTLLLFAGIGLPFRSIAARLKPVLWTLVVLTVFKFLVGEWQMLVPVILRVSALMIAAVAVTATTSIAALIDEISVLARPLEKTGWVKAGDIGLAVGLMIRFIPDIFNRYQAICDAHDARGIKRRPITLLAPLVILSLRDADNIAAAIDARRIRGH